MRVAFFGGSFDPPHLGHQRIALAAADRMALDRVLLVPVAVQPLKRGAAAPASYVDRAAMLRLLIAEAGDERLEVAELDAPRVDGRPNYTFETLERLRGELAAEDTLFLLTGADALETLPQWHRAVELVCSVGMIVATRPGFVLEDLYPSLLHLLEDGEFLLPEEQFAGVEHRVLAPLGNDRRAQINGPLQELHRSQPAKPEAHFYFLTELEEDISATGIRAALREGRVPQGLASRVLDYIRAHGLYRNGAPGEV